MEESCNENKEQFISTIKECDSELQKHPENPEKYYYLKASAYFELKEFENAILWSSKAIAIKKDISAFYIVRGDAYFQLGYYEEAEKDYEILVKLWPAWDEGWTRLEEVKKKLCKE